MGSKSFLQNPNDINAMVKNGRNASLAPASPDSAGNVCGDTLFQSELQPNQFGQLLPQEGIVVFQQQIITDGITNDIAVGNPLLPAAGFFLKLRTFYCQNTQSILFQYQSNFPQSSIAADCLLSNGNGVPILDTLSTNWGGVNAPTGINIPPSRKLVPIVRSSSVSKNYSVVIIALHLMDCFDNWKVQD